MMMEAFVWIEMVLPAISFRKRLFPDVLQKKVVLLEMCFFPPFFFATLFFERTTILR